MFTRYFTVVVWNRPCYLSLLIEVMKRATQGREKSLYMYSEKKSKQVPKKKTKAKFLEDKKKTLTNSGKETSILVPVLLPRLHLLIFPISTNAS